ncbi:MAG: hypothetical protein AVDCRST_MAG38-2885, partial [uncultured Solirubrobacteraceae bacterium]
EPEPQVHRPVAGGRGGADADLPAGLAGDAEPPLRQQPARRPHQPALRRLHPEPPRLQERRVGERPRGHAPPRAPALQRLRARDEHPQLPPLPRRGPEPDRVDGDLAVRGRRLRAVRVGAAAALHARGV